ncbi:MULTISPECIES: Asp-tRNA(Asn)/Glu-tRNA(Gln) amidotransferase subunit GatC [unclassified Haematospirillum]|uniref:Asp-tRNA(Asn)/Glu-tRNA(Gln) amidotransferase subunit GatC n=1 Tax=unclassified Haematospirillum TaxID=2622088 RepID=UPI00143BAA0A|nr:MULTISPECIES: Asp-tRNA(Asn)/Glu-tRNA(Gln) amidotransferase subunit GatC [unclassified Haematospirillum]NKD54417.1 Asp-tRNA(Asn)/Glu-tRNA(Gln) amidotransferase subunit GatC [Haematospirillum sp. H4890]NKD74460.1 Asp-tRNA(Asn)/Glu-tRNA(Gln) amidotransferase subunit GatC [Haematospirillum sp. H4485]NKD86869.1 Asp-tRNA(Asn)/Glu-tRNA(Gln) amidotransferase subunit GatC [Haematospirillum sp. 15-248]
MSLDKDIVRNVAFLARIEVPEDRLDPLASQLSGILDWVEQLADVNTEGTEPMTSVTDAVLRWREDIVSDGGMCDSILANAPEAMDGFFAVPKVVE